MAGAGNEDLDRNLAFLVYALLFFSFFFAGAPALIGVAIAYSRRHEADPLIRRHHAYQIMVFWIGFGLAAISAVMGLAVVVVGVASAFRVLTDADGANFETFFDEVYQQSVASHAIPVLLLAAFVFLITTGVWLVGASGYGFFRLASNKTVGQSA